MQPKDLTEEHIYRLAFTFIDGVGPKTAKLLTEHFGNARDAFAAPVKVLKSVPGVGEARAKYFKDANVLHRAEAEIEKAESQSVQLFFHQDEDFPKKLKMCVDAPLVLYYAGTAKIETKYTVAIVGTRKNTDYGCQLTEDLLQSLKVVKDLTIVSGLANGIDGIAHRAALQAQLPTIGVLAHGLDNMYPSNHRKLSQEMLEKGGLLTEFPFGMGPEKTNFPVRNRIVAGLSDVTVIVESNARGGAMITAYMAASYNREVAAFPGRVSDTRSEGPLKLVRMNVASLIRNGEDLLDVMGWSTAPKEKTVQKTLLLALTDSEQCVVDAMMNKDSIHTDELMLNTKLSSGVISATLLQLEMQGIVRAMPGKQYRLS